MDIRDVFGERSRPEHPDFWKLSSIVLQLDGRTEDESEDAFDRGIKDARVDPQSVSYLSVQRALRALDVQTFEDLQANPQKMQLLMVLSAIYLDGFTAGSIWGQNLD